MSTFVVNFIGAPESGFQGRVEHVPSGERSRFASVTDLLLFFEEMNASSGLGEAEVEGSNRSDGDP